jgi:DeoR/GlpR family transcriptional regulator of sugar metabolism
MKGRKAIAVAFATALLLAAAALVEPGDALMLDAGSTTCLSASALAVRNLHLTVVTNCLPVAHALGAAERCRVILCPGDYIEREAGVFGPEAVAFLRKYHANKAFIGAGGVAPDGISDAHSAGCAIKRAMLECAKHSALLADSSKFDAVQFERVAPLAAVDRLVSDAAPARRLATALRAAGVEVTLAS